MKRTENFFVIDNYNTVPEKLLEYCKNYIIYNASTDITVQEQLKEKGLKYVNINRTGHNISTYFTYFIENHDILPDVICLTKGHMVGRHCSEEFFNRVYDNKYFTFLYSDENVNLTKGVSFLTMENQYLEINNSWYVNSKEHPHKYFDNFNRLLKFIYKNPIIPQYCIFAPGGCYIIKKEQVLKHSKQFYKNLNKVITYGLSPNFPSEAHQIERMLPIIFEANYEKNDWMDSEEEFNKKLEVERLITIKNEKNKNKFRLFSHNNLHK